MPRRGPRVAALVIAATVAIVATACSVLPSDGPVARLENRTTVAVAVHMNGDWVGTYPPGADVDVPIRSAQGPVVIEARSPSGAVLVSYTATEDDIAGTSGGAGGSVLPCGSIRLSVSTVELEPMPTPEVPPGPCP